MAKGSRSIPKPRVKRARRSRYLSRPSTSSNFGYELGPTYSLPSHSVYRSLPASPVREPPPAHVNPPYYAPSSTRSSPFGSSSLPYSPPRDSTIRARGPTVPPASRGSIIPRYSIAFLPRNYSGSTPPPRRASLTPAWPGRASQLEPVYDDSDF